MQVISDRLGRRTDLSMGGDMIHQASVRLYYIWFDAAVEPLFSL